MRRATSKPIAPERVTPPLPADVARLLLGGLRSRNADRKRIAMEACLAARAFAAGFCRGADPERAYRRHVIGPHHEHWLRGYDAGQRAAEQAAVRYLRDQLLPPSATGIAHVSAPTATTADGCRAHPIPRRARDARDAHTDHTTTQPVLSEVPRWQAQSLNSRSAGSAPADAAR
jgi:hypothetical protein